ncbi:nucleotidyltransferase [Bacillus phage Shbh1]|uniref:Putative nucleotidyltransferase-like protein n=1 Tax=Bacillus phage Shbh1 TaxID=1796992 RepID=A0A142F1B2_9CAUD|nr:nucleotidyltransferase [Bacillus phage Shbh1]AMQ66569.1 putative nucleotidyltransferase-like protein [Bacillus phage Shbh1]
MINNTVSFKALVGSHNYNLNTQDSDRDFKVFVYPSFNDLYGGGITSKSTTSESFDLEYHDIRRLPQLLFKSNINFIEVLFSQEHDGDSLFKTLVDLREDVARMNLPYLYNACKGTFINKYKSYKKKKDTDPKKSNKDAATAIRIHDFLVRYYLLDFDNFGLAIRYGSNGEDPISPYFREQLISIRNGDWDPIVLEDYLEDSNRKLTDGIGIIQSSYYKASEDLKTQKLITDTVKNHVREHISQEFK